MKDQEKIEERLEVTVDQVLEEHVGSFGFSQLLHVFLVSLAWVIDSQTTLVSIFADSQPGSWRCLGLSCGVGKSTKSGVGSVCGLKAGSWEWVDGNSSTTIAEWHLFCHHKFLAAIPTSLFFLGSLLGSGISGHLADTVLGRKTALLLTCLLMSTTNFLTSLSPNLSVYSILRFAAGFSRPGIAICSHKLSTESVGRKWRHQVGHYSFFFYATGFLSLPLIAYPTRNSWRNLYRIISAFPLAYSLFVLLPFVSESPLWLTKRGRSKEAVEILKKHARINGRMLPVNLKLSEEQLENNGEGVVVPVKRNIARVVMMVTGFGIGFVYYGLQFNLENLDFNLYFAAALNAMIEVPAVFIGCVLLSFMDRRLLFSRAAYVAGLSCIACIIFSFSGKESKGSWLQLASEASGFMAASIGLPGLCIFCKELKFSVSGLHKAFMVGAFVAPLTVVLGRENLALSFLVLGIFSMFSGLVSLWLPETRNGSLYETLVQEESLKSVA